MKKTLIMLCALLAVAGMSAQKKNVSQAKSLLYAEPVDYDKAIALIDQAKADPTTANEANTWYVAGRIGYTMVYEDSPKYLAKMLPSTDRFYKGLTLMYDNYMKADALDGQPDKKGNPKYVVRKNIRNDFKEHLSWYMYLGFDYYNSQDYERAGVLFDDYLSIVNAPMFTEKDGVKVDSIYAQVLYMATVCATNTQQEAKFAALVEELKNTPSDYQQFAYELMSAEYQKKGDMENYAAALREGVAKFPKNAFMAGSLINYYLSIDKYEDGIAYLDQMIAQNPDNVEYNRVKASVLIQVKKYDEARVILDECLKKDPSDVATYFYLGRSWAEQGDDRQQYAEDNWNKLSKKDYTAANEEAFNCYGKALDIYESVHAKMEKGNPLYHDLLQNMYILYVRLSKMDKAKEIKGELEQL